jgi:anaerobic ribonucleoside-triphosphate reductase activating protein
VFPSRFWTAFAINQLLALNTSVRKHLASTLLTATGEPMLQAEGLVSLIGRVRKETRKGNSRFTFAQLRRKALLEPGIKDLLSQLDVLNDGLDRADLNDGLGLRGSSNQRVYFLTSRYGARNEEFERGPREIEIHLLKKEMLMVGVPLQIPSKPFSHLPVK